MQFIGSPVATTCVGQAASTAALLLAGGEPGAGRVLPHARVVLHQPSGGGQGALPDLALQAKEIVRLRAEMETILSRHTGQTVERLREDTGRDLVLNAQEAVAYGVVDGVLDSRKAFRLPEPQAASASGPRRPARQRPGEPGGEVDEPQAEGTGDCSEDLRAGLLAAALDLGEVLRRDAGLLGDVGERALLLVAHLAQLATDRLSPQRFWLGASDVRCCGNPMTSPMNRQ